MASAKLARQVLEDLDGPGVLGEVRDRDRAVREHEVEAAVEVRGRPSESPQPVKFVAEGRRERRPAVDERGAAAAEDGVRLAARVADEEVEPAVPE